jgi:hypothetical protein
MGQDGRVSRVGLVSAVALLAAACAVAGCSAGVDEETPATAPASAGSVDPEQRYPDVLAATLLPRSETTFDVEVTISSPYDTPQRYADGWRVLTQDGVELGSHTLLHDHAGEQPFTRRQSDLTIPNGVDVVIVEGRDLVHGYGGGTVEAVVPD